MEEEGTLHNVLEAKLQMLLWYRSLLGEGTADREEILEIRRRGNAYEGKLLSGDAWASSGLLEPVVDELLQDARQALQQRLDARVASLGELAQKLRGDRAFTVPELRPQPVAGGLRDTFGDLFDMVLGKAPRRPRGGVEPAYYPPAPPPKKAPAPEMPAASEPSPRERLQSFLLGAHANLVSGEIDRLATVRDWLIHESVTLPGTGVGIFDDPVLAPHAMAIVALLTPWIHASAGTARVPPQNVLAAVVEHAEKALRHVGMVVTVPGGPPMPPAPAAAPAAPAEAAAPATPPKQQACVIRYHGQDFRGQLQKDITGMAGPIRGIRGVIAWKDGNIAVRSSFSEVEHLLLSFGATHRLNAIEMIAVPRGAGDQAAQRDINGVPMVARAEILCASDAPFDRALRGTYNVTSFPDGVLRRYLGTLYTPRAPVAPMPPPEPEASKTPAAPPAKMDTVGRYFLANLWQHLRPDLRTPKSIATAARALREMEQDEVFDSLRKGYGAELTLIKRSLHAFDDPTRVDPFALQQTFLSREAAEAAGEAERAKLDNVAEIAKDLYDRSR